MVIGHIDSVSNGEISGWALDRANPENPVKITVYANGRPVCETLAVHHRPDVGERYQCSGLHGFHIDLVKCLPAGASVQLEVALGEERLLTEAPLDVEVPVREPGSEDVVLFMHIPKTAGTSLREAIVENYLLSEVAYLYPDPPGVPGGDLRVLPLEQRARFRCVIGHFRFGIHRWLPGSSQYVTLVRDPVERVISHYKHLVAFSPDVISEENKLLPIEVALQRRVSCDLDNLLVRYFAGVCDSAVPAGSASREHYEQALANLETGFMHVGHQEDVQGTYDYLAGVLDWPPRPVDRRMVSQITTESLGEPDQVMAAIRCYAEWDVALYEKILERFPKRAAKGKPAAAGI